MKIGDLVKWTLFEEMGVVLSDKRKPRYYEVYCLSDGLIYCINEANLRLINNKITEKQWHT